MKINAVSSNQSFKAKLSPRVEDGFKKLGIATLIAYGDNSHEFDSYLTSMGKILNPASDYGTLEIKDYYSGKTSDIMGLGGGGTVKSSVHYDTFVLTSDNLPDRIVHQCSNTKDLFSLETLEEVAKSVDFLGHKLRITEWELINKDSALQKAQKYKSILNEVFKKTKEE